MNKYNHSIFLFLIAFITIVFSSCNSYMVLPDQYLEPGRNNFPSYSFNYKVPLTQNKGNLTLALVSPVFSLTGNTQYLHVSSYSSEIFKSDLSDDVREYIDKLISNYLTALQSDFENVLITNGFHTIGPFANREMLTYLQREQSDLALEPRVFIDVISNTKNVEQPKSVRSKFQNVSVGSQNYDEAYQTNIHPGIITGTLNLTVRIELHLSEPLSWEKMWIKNIFSPTLESFEYNYKFNTINGKIIFGEDTRSTALVSLLTRTYKVILDNFNTYFDPREIEKINQKAIEVRQKKRF